MEINLPKNHHHKIRVEEAIISCKKCMKKCKKTTCLKWTYGQIYRVATFSTLYISVSGIIIPSLNV